MKQKILFKKECMETCDVCKKMRILNIQGFDIADKWFCCWRCVQEARARGMITKEDIREAGL